MHSEVIQNAKEIFLTCRSKHSVSLSDIPDVVSADAAKTTQNFVIVLETFKTQ